MKNYLIGAFMALAMGGLLLATAACKKVDDPGQVPEQSNPSPTPPSTAN